MYATSNSARAPAARILAAVCTELPRTYFTVAPVAFSNAVAWHFFELSTKVPPNVATTNSSADAGNAKAAVSRHINEIRRSMVMVADSSGERVWWRDYSSAAPSSQPGVRALSGQAECRVESWLVGTTGGTSHSFRKRNASVIISGVG